MDIVNLILAKALKKSSSTISYDNSTGTGMHSNNVQDSIDELSMRESLKYEFVSELPEEGVSNIIYIVPKETPSESNYSDEYIWDSNNQTYEKIGDTQVADTVIYNVTSGSSVYTLQNNKKIKDVDDDIMAGKTVILYAPSNTNHPIYICVGRGIFCEFSTFSESLNGQTGLSCTALIYNKTMPNNNTFNVKSIRMPNLPRLDLGDSNGKILGVSSTGDPKYELVDPTPNANPNIANAYNPGIRYSFPDLCIYEGELYICNDEDVTGEWDSEYWDSITIAECVSGVDEKVPYPDSNGDDDGKVLKVINDRWEAVTLPDIPDPEHQTLFYIYETSNHYVFYDTGSEENSIEGLISSYGSQNVALYDYSTGKTFLPYYLEPDYADEYKFICFTDADNGSLDHWILQWDDANEYFVKTEFHDANHNIASAYDSTATYDLGDLCIYNGNLYECSTAISTAEEWTAAHWTQKTVAQELAGAGGSDIVAFDCDRNNGTNRLTLKNNKTITDIKTVLNSGKNVCLNELDVNGSLRRVYYFCGIENVYTSGTDQTSITAMIFRNDFNDRAGSGGTTEVGNLHFRYVYAKYSSAVSTFSDFNSTASKIESISKAYFNFGNYFKNTVVENDAKGDPKHFNLSAANIADVYNSTSTYNSGDLAISLEDHKLYKCNTDNTTGNWNSTKWDQVTVEDLLNAIPALPTVTSSDKGKVLEVNSSGRWAAATPDYAKDTSVAPLYDDTATYSVGDIVMYNKELYECTTAISVAEAWDSTHWTKADILDIIDSKISDAVTSVLNTSF